MKLLNADELSYVSGGAAAVVGATVRTSDFDWGQFGLVTGVLAVCGALMGAVAGASNTSSLSSSERKRENITGGLLGGALLAGAVGAAADATYQMAPSLYGGGIYSH